jgi:hypothetical protein
MRVELSASFGSFSLAQGELAQPGIYVVVHRAPHHRTPHEILIEKPTALPPCNSCLGVRFNFKSQLPVRLEHSGMFRMQLDLDAMVETTNRLIAESRKILSRFNSHWAQRSGTLEATSRNFQRDPKLDACSVNRVSFVSYNLKSWLDTGSTASAQATSALALTASKRQHEVVDRNRWDEIIQVQVITDPKEILDIVLAQISNGIPVQCDRCESVTSIEAALVALDGSEGPFLVCHECLDVFLS